LFTAKFDMQKTRGGTYGFALKIAKGGIPWTEKPHRHRAVALAGVNSVRPYAAGLNGASAAERPPTGSILFDDR
jgi:uncharacterized protein YegP (UPF0339 family)